MRIHTNIRLTMTSTRDSRTTCRWSPGCSIQHERPYSHKCSGHFRSSPPTRICVVTWTQNHSNYGECSGSTLIWDHEIGDRSVWLLNMNRDGWGLLVPSEMVLPVAEMVAALTLPFGSSETSQEALMFSPKDQYVNRHPNMCVYIYVCVVYIYILFMYIFMYILLSWWWSLSWYFIHISYVLPNFCLPLIAARFRLHRQWAPRCAHSLATVENLGRARTHRKIIGKSMKILEKWKFQWENQN